MARTRQPEYLVCLRSGKYRASLEPRKIYESIPDADAEELGMVRVVDESGEDYLFPQSLFMRIALAPTEIRAIRKAG